MSDFVCLLLGLAGGFWLGTECLSRGVIYLAKKRLTPQEREEIGGLFLKLMGKA
jgi:hypothetical protein